MMNARGCEASDTPSLGDLGDDLGNDFGNDLGDNLGNGIAGHRDRRSGGALAAITFVIRRGARAFTELIDAIFNGIGCLAPLLCSASCQSGSDVAVAPPVTEQLPAPADAAPAEIGPHSLGKFTVTFYYLIGEDEVTAVNDNRGSNESEDTELTAITPDLVTLYRGGGACEPIAEVSKEFASQLALQGTGKLHDGRVLNIWGACNCGHTPCFKVTRAQWGTAGSGKPLHPFRTVAVDPKVVKLGSLLYVPLLEGRTMPGRPPWGGYVHDGCVIADDTGGHIAGNRLDLFVGRKAYFLGISGSGGSHAWARHVPVFDGTGICDRKRRPARAASST
jgi:3D (Asp-Asp-Asp) domain-containing protein